MTNTTRQLQEMMGSLAMSATFRHVSFTGKRTEWETSQIAGCVADAAPNANFVPCAPEFLGNAQHLYTVADVRYMGWN